MGVEMAASSGPRTPLRCVCLVAAAVAALTGGASGANTRPFPDTSTRIAVLTDQLPETMTDAQVRFAATHYVGTQKLTLNLSQPLRAINQHAGSMPGRVANDLPAHRVRRRIVDAGNLYRLTIHPSRMSIDAR